MTPFFEAFLGAVAGTALTYGLLRARVKHAEWTLKNLHEARSRTARKSLEAVADRAPRASRAPQDEAREAAARQAWLARQREETVINIQRSEAATHDLIEALRRPLPPLPTLPPIRLDVDTITLEQGAQRLRDALYHQTMADPHYSMFRTSDLFDITHTTATPEAPGTTVKEAAPVEPPPTAWEHLVADESGRSPQDAQDDTPALGPSAPDLRNEF